MGEGCRECRYLWVNGFVEFQADFVHIVRLPLDALDGNSLSSQVNLGMLQINCIDRQVDNVLFFIRLTGSLRPCHYTPQLAPIARKKRKSGRGGGSTFWMEIIGHFRQGQRRRLEKTSGWMRWRCSRAKVGMCRCLSFWEREFDAVSTCAWKKREDKRNGHNCNTWVRALLIAILFELAAGAISFARGSGTHHDKQAIACTIRNSSAWK